MKNINKNLIALMVVPAFILTFSFASPVFAGSFLVGSGATVTSINTNNIVNPAPIAFNPSPIIYSINPSSASVGSGSMIISITGANFIPTSLAEINNTYRSTGYIDSNHLTMTLNGSDLATPGNYLITVTNPAPGGGTSNVEYFTVQGFGQPTAFNTNGNGHGDHSSFGGLSANALSAGFLPNNPLEWLLLFLIILLIVIIVRKLMNKNKEASLTVLTVSTTSVTLGATGLTPNVVHVFEVTGALGSNSKPYSEYSLHCYRQQV